MKVYFATWLADRALGRGLTKKRGNNRLLSYYFLKEQEVIQEQLCRYCETGRCDIRKTKRRKL